MMSLTRPSISSSSSTSTREEGKRDEPLNAKQVLKNEREAREREARVAATGILLRHAAFLGTPKLSALLGPSRKADPNRADSSGWSPLHYACTNGKVDSVRALLKRNADPDVKTSKGWTPLHAAAFHGHEACILVLLDAGADRDVETIVGTVPLTPYSMADKWGHTSIMRLLTTWQPAPDDTDDEDDDVHSLTSQSKQEEDEEEEAAPVALTWAQKQAAAKEAERKIAAAVAARQAREQAAREKKARDKAMGKGIPGSEYEKNKVKKLQQKFADRLKNFTTIPEHQLTPIFENYNFNDNDNDQHKNNKNNVQNFGKLNKNSNKRNQNRNHQIKTNMKMVKTLNGLGHGSNNRKVIGVSGSGGGAAAARKGGRNVGGGNSRGNSRGVSTANATQLMLQTKFRNAAELNDVEELKRLAYGHYLEIDAVDVLRGNVTALHLAAMKGNVEVVEFLLTEAHAHTESINIFGETSLHLAADRGFSDIVEKLLIGEANPEALNKYGETPFDLASTNGHTSVIKLLLPFTKSQSDNDLLNSDQDMNESDLQSNLEKMDQSITNQSLSSISQNEPSISSGASFSTLSNTSINKLKHNENVVYGTTKAAVKFKGRNSASASLFQGTSMMSFEPMTSASSTNEQDDNGSSKNLPFISPQRKSVSSLFPNINTM